MTQISVSFETMRSIASMGAFVNKKDAALGLRCVKVDFDGNNITAYASNRYSAVILKEASAVEFPSLLLEEGAIKFLSGLKALRGSDYPVMITDLGERKFTIEFGMNRLLFENPDHSYPDVSKLPDTRVPATTFQVVRYNIEEVAKLAKLLGRDGKKITAWDLSAGDDERRSPTLAIEGSGLYSVLIMPMKKEK